MSSFDLFCIGDSAIDIFLKVDTGLTPYQDKVCFLHGSKILVNEYSDHTAGNVCNVSAGAALLGLNSGLYTEIGRDAYGQKIVSDLKEKKVNVDYICGEKDSVTNVHVILSTGLERTIFSYHAPREYHMDQWPNTKWLFYSSLAKGFEKFQAQIVEHVNKNPSIGVVFNPGTVQLSQGVNSLRDILSITDILIVNKEEALRLLEINQLVGNDLSVIHEKLLKFGPKLSVITDGEKGSSAFDGKSFVKVGAYKLDSPVADKTGAGDAFTSGFISALFYGKSLKESLKWGAINSSYCIRTVGSTNGLCTKKMIEDALVKFAD